MEEQQLARRERTRKQLLWTGTIATLAFLIIVVCGYLFEWEWTGFPRRTAWDWLDLLIVPAVLAVGGVLFSQLQQRRDRVSADRQAQDDALEAYLDDMTDLMVVHQLLSPPQWKDPTGVRSVARARTLTVLRRVDGERKGHVVQFLYESGLILTGGAIVDLYGADLSSAYLSSAYLSGANLGGANLSGARLDYAHLEGASLDDSMMPDGDRLMNAPLARVGKGPIVKGLTADLQGASLIDAHLKGASLRAALLFKANLKGTDLSGAKLNSAKG